MTHEMYTRVTKTQWVDFVEKYQQTYGTLHRDVCFLMDPVTLCYRDFERESKIEHNMVAYHCETDETVDAQYAAAAGEADKVPVIFGFWVQRAAFPGWTPPEDWHSLDYTPEESFR